MASNNSLKINPVGKIPNIHPQENNVTVKPTSCSPVVIVLQLKKPPCKTSNVNCTFIRHFDQITAILTSILKLQFRLDWILKWFCWHMLCCKSLLFFFFFSLPFNHFILHLPCHVLQVLDAVSVLNQEKKSASSRAFSSPVAHLWHQILSQLKKKF